MSTDNKSRKSSYPTFPKTVQECAELLDTVMPDWYTEIDERLLNLTSGTKCILGQLYGEYHNGITELFGKHPRLLTDEYILCINDPHKQEWLAQIALRKAASGPITFSTQGKHVAIPGTMMNQGMADLMNSVEGPLVTPGAFTVNIPQIGAALITKKDVPALIETLKKVIKELEAV